MRKIKRLEKELKDLKAIVDNLDHERKVREFKEKPDEILHIIEDPFDPYIITSSGLGRTVRERAKRWYQEQCVFFGHTYQYNDKYSSYELLTKVEAK